MARRSRKFFGAFLAMKSQQAKTSKALQGKPMQEHRHCLLGSTYILSKLHISPQVSALAKHPFMLSASAKHPLIRQSHHMTQLSLPKSQKFPLHTLIIFSCSKNTKNFQDSTHSHSGPHVVQWLLNGSFASDWTLACFYQ